MNFIILLSIIYAAFALPIEDDALQEFISGNRRFAASVYKEILKEKSDNVLVSPLSAEIVLALTNEGARGETSAELVTGLSLPKSKENVQKALQLLVKKLGKSQEDHKLLSANKIYTNLDVELEDSFKSIATSVYSAGVDNVDFSRNIEASATINRWVEDNTNNKIKDLISPAEIDNSTKIILVNALYFSGKWVNEFQEYATKKKSFFATKDNAIETVTMSQVEYFDYYENPTLNAKFLELPYKGENTSMIIVLPNEIEGLTDVEQNIEKFLEPQPLTKQKVKVDLPKFSTETEIKFVPILQRLGIRKLFSEADLSGLSSNVKDLVVSDVIQKAFINVTETGTEAAAATGVLLVPLSGFFDPNPIVAEFKADHPFFYYIKSNGVILFCGRHSKPTL